jgi:hypothetical protein
MTRLGAAGTLCRLLQWSAHALSGRPSAAMVTVILSSEKSAAVAGPGGLRSELMD